MTPTTIPTTLTSLRDQNRGCTACSLRAGCKSPVPSSGPQDAKVMLVGEAPGRVEDERGLPFIGQAGDETTNYLEVYSRIPRSGVVITNSARCRPKGNRTPYARELEACWQWLAHELDQVQPKFIIAAGATALHTLLGYSYDIDMWHGIPIEVEVSELGRTVDKEGLLATLIAFGGWTGKVTVIPTYHPAYGLHDGSKMKALQEDFTTVGRVVRGMYKRKVDEWAGQEDYITGGLAERTQQSLGWGNAPLDQSIIAMDTEFEDGKMWCLSLSGFSGESWVVFPDDEEDMDCLRKWVQDPSHTVVFHNAVADLPMLAQHGIHPVSVADTMIMAYVLGLQQGLKTLAFRECGMEMRSYEEVVEESTRKRAIEYLYTVLDHPWIKPPPFYQWKKNQQMVVNPWHIHRTVGRILEDEVTKGVNPVARWKRIDELKGRKVVEEELGPIPFGRLSDIPREDAIRYAARDADATIRVYNVLKGRIEEAGLEEVVKLDVAILPMLNDMMTAGMRVDVEVFKTLAREHVAILEDLVPEIALSGEMVINPASRDQVSNLLFDKLKIPPPSYTKTGLFSTDNETLNLIVDAHPVVPLVIKHREYHKRLTAFLEPLPRWARKDGRVHPQVRNTIAKSGRLACRRPNMTQIPQRSTEGRRIREGIIAADGCRLICGDYSQIELRILAHKSGDDGLVTAFWTDVDLHVYTAGCMNARPIEAYAEPMSTDRELERSHAKTFNYGIPYGLTPEGLMVKVKAETHGVVVWTLEEARRFHDAWFETFPGVREYMEKVFEKIRLNGYATDMFGRRRLVPEVRSVLSYVVERGLREGFNHVIQGTAAEIIKKAMVETTPLYREFRERGFTCNPLMQVHDELIFEVQEEAVEEFVPRMKEIMEGVVTLIVDLPVGIGVGRTWAEAK